MSKAGNQPITRAMRLEIEQRRRVREGPLPTDPPSWWWLTYADNAQWQGVVVIEATTYKQAVGLAWNRGHAPSKGHPSGVILDAATLAMLSAAYRNRLLTGDDLKTLEGQGHKFVTVDDMKREKENKAFGGVKLENLVK